MEIINTAHMPALLLFSILIGIFAGSSIENVIQIRLYISDIELWGKVDERYSKFFETHKPARSIIPTRELHFGCLIEIEAIAVGI